MLHERTGAPLTPSSRARLDRALEPARRTLAPEAADAAWQVGRALDLDQIVEAALAVTAPSEGRREPSAVENPTAKADAASALTRREQEVATLIGRGLTNRQIAEHLVITEGTAANHVVHILNKLDFGSRAQVAVWAAEHGLL
jgi:DNA-binding NarL/FixJ family response regulator